MDSEVPWSDQFLSQNSRGYTLESLPSNGGLVLKLVGTKRPNSSNDLTSKVDLVQIHLSRLGKD